MMSSTTHFLERHEVNPSASTTESLVHLPPGNRTFPGMQATAHLAGTSFFDPTAIPFSRKFGSYPANFPPVTREREHVDGSSALPRIHQISSPIAAQWEEREVQRLSSTTGLNDNSSRYCEREETFQ